MWLRQHSTVPDWLAEVGCTTNLPNQSSKTTQRSSLLRLRLENLTVIFRRNSLSSTV